MPILKICLLLSLILAGCSQNENEVTGQRGPFVRDEPSPPNKSDETVPAQAVGFYAQGSLINDTEFPSEGNGFIKVFRARNRHFITRHLLAVISFASREVAKTFPGGERLQIGDIAKRSGGKLSLHASHQNGLDADIAYYRLNKREMDPEGFGGFDEVFVRNGKVTANFDLERNYEVMKYFVSTGRVNRIFVDVAIKTKFCELSKGHELSELDRETIRRMRPLENHKDHMHLRIKCPLTSPDCQTQVEPPEGMGCPATGQMLFNMFDPTED